MYSDNFFTGSVDTLLPSILNSSNLTQRDNEAGMSINLLYRNPNRLKLVKFPNVSGISHNSLCCKSKCVKARQFPSSVRRKQKIVRRRRKTSKF